ncbi:hypothetical protein [Edaphobacter bradus]|uniref:hypothetical protein n=1 Tax=Edaphobacter bradus TaxID=2259016 RepID=UPI0021DFBA92|nr:hypothetical protein [Edaphobacter bradus]
MTAFRHFYAEEAARYFAKTALTWEAARDAWYNDSWFCFRSRELPKGVVIVHKPRFAAVDFAFSNTRKEELERALARCTNPEGLEPVQTSKSASIRLSVPLISDFGSTEQNKENIFAAFDAVNRLVQFWGQNKAILQELVEAKSNSVPNYESNQNWATLRAVEAMLHGLIRVRMIEFNADPGLKLPDLVAMAKHKESKIWFPVPGMAGGFDIRLVQSDDSKPVIIASSGSRIGDGWMRHKVTLFEVTSKSIDYLSEPSLDEWAASFKPFTQHPSE